MRAFALLFSSFLLRRLANCCALDIACSSGLAWHSNNIINRPQPHNTSNSNLHPHHSPASRPTSVLITFHPHPSVLLLIQHPSSAASTTLKRQWHQRTLHHQPLPNSVRRRCQRRNMRHLRRWPRRRSCSALAARSGRPFPALLRHPPRHQVHVRQRGTLRKSGACSKVQQLYASSMSTHHHHRLLLVSWKQQRWHRRSLRRYKRRRVVS